MASYLTPVSPESLATRRAFLAGGVRAAAGASLFSPLVALAQSQNATASQIKLCLTPGSIGVTAGQMEAIALAHRHGFDAVEPYGAYLAERSDMEIEDIMGQLKEWNLAWGAAGLPVEFRQSDDRFEAGIKELPKIAAALTKAGAMRVGTWLSPGHDSLTYEENMKQHATRLGEAARILKDHGQRLGLEYVGTFTLRARRKHAFVHSLAQTMDLITEIGTGNVGVVLDTWHWWQAGETGADILSLKNEDIVSLDLNDAPAGVAKNEQMDGQRELPMATGVIEVGEFLKSLRQIGYSGPARPEPFNRALNALDNDAACEATIAAMRKAMSVSG
jgi:sugar phosphate isomerase/epimerase